MMLSIITSCCDIFAMHLYYILDRRAGRAPAVALTATAPTPTTPVIAPTTASVAAATVANELGNECCSKSQFQEAIQHFSSAITVDGTKHMPYANRSYAYQQIKSWKCAIADARKVSITLA